jgi:LacI family transcriptional regulator
MVIYSGRVLAWGIGVVKREDVARLAGVSPAVVSYVVNNGPRPVAEGTRRRVVKAIDRLGYRPNGVARALRSRRTWSIGLVVPGCSDPFLARLAHAIEDEAFARGYSLLLGNPAGDRAREANYVRTFQDRQVDGLIVVTDAPTKDLASVYEGDVPMVVFTDDRVPGMAVSTVRVDNVEAARVATAHLISHGHRSVCCIAGTRGSAWGQQRLTGWQQAMRGAGLKAPARQVRWAGLEPSAAHRAAGELLSVARPPTGVFVATDQQAIGVLRAAADLGLSVPHDVAVIGFDGIVDADYTVPRLATMRQPVVAMARRAVEILGPDAVTDWPVHEVFPVSLVARGSCGCPDTTADSDARPGRTGTILRGR